MKKNKDPTAAATKQSGPDNHDLNHHCADEANSMLHMKAEIHRLRAEVARLKHLQLKEPTSRPKSKNSRERRSYSLSSRPARTKQKDHEVVGDLELCSSITTTTTTKDRHPSANGLHHRRHPHEFVSLLKNSNSSPENSLLSKHSESNVEDQLESQQQMQPEDEITCADVSFTSVVIDRAGWLVGLLVLQSLSSFIIQRNEILLQDHVVIIRFLTMLIGAGGNAGNQATVKGPSH